MPTWQMQTWPQLDRWLNFSVPPPFLAVVQSKERAWWRIALILALGAVGFFAISFVGLGVATAVGMGVLRLLGEGGGLQETMDIVLTTGVPHQDSSLTHEIVRVITLGVLFGGMAAALLLVLKLINGRPMRGWITTAPRFRWRLLLAGLGLYGAVLAAWFAGNQLFGLETLKPPVLDQAQALDVRLAYLLIVVVCLLVAAAFEEILCRGWLMQLTGAFTRNLIPLLLINGLIFSALHMDADLGRNISRLATGVVLSWATLRLGGLEFAIGAHTANNLMIALFASTITASLGDTAPSTLGEVAADLALSAVLVGLVELAARWTPLRRWTGVA